MIHTPAVLLQFQGKDAISDGEDLQVPCKLDMTGQQQYVNILKQELHKTKEIQ